jgi:glycosyltransferase involved in cell wall biosynthesis
VGVDYEVSPRDYGISVISLGGLRDDTSLVSAYSCCNIVCIPSLCDNLPNVALEAQACGKPIVCFATGGMIDIVTHGKNGLVCTSICSESLAEMLFRMYSNDSFVSSLSHASRCHATDFWNPAVIAQQYEDAYYEVLAIK